jgi:ABC-type glycerol-3-phosphate transport system substrate-binding protein
MKTKVLFALVAASALLAACGGGGGGDTAPAPTPDPDAIIDMPASAAATEEAFKDTLAALPADDRANPLGLDRVNLPTSDTTEPLPLE